MHFLPLLSLLTTLTSAKLLVDFNATRGDDPRVIGQLNLQADRANTIAYKSADLFFNKGQDWKGHPAAHVHRKQDYIRAEYHALKNKTKQGETYWIGYTFALEEIQQSLMIWQWKEYAANNAKDNGANIPLSLEVVGGKLIFAYQADASSGRKAQKSFDVAAKTQYDVGFEIDAKPDDGSVKLWWEGKPVTFDNGSEAVTGNMFPKQSEPKFGAYRGEAVEINTWVYGVQISNEQDELDEKYFSG